MEIQNKYFAPEIETNILAEVEELVLEEAGIKNAGNYYVKIKAELCPLGLLDCCGQNKHDCCPNRPEYFAKTHTIALTKYRNNIGYVKEFAHEFWHLCAGDTERLDYNDPREIKAREIAEKITKKIIEREHRNAVPHRP